MNNLSLIFKVLSIVFLFSLNVSAKEVNSDFEIWVNDLKKAVQDKNYQQDFIDEVFLNIYYSKEYIEEDKKQFKPQTFAQYYKNAINNRRIRKAKAKINKNNVILNKVESKFQVPKEYIVALWAIETDFGLLKGDFNVINSLANLSFNKRRRELFLNEFFAAIKIVNDNNMSAKKLKGSWAGAIGQCQFLPSTYLKYGYDFDNDGIVDIWRNKSDIFASIANYLKSIGWDNNINWGYEINYNKELAKMSNSKEKYNLKLLLDKYKISKKNNSKFNNREILSKVSLVNQDNKIFVVFNNFDLIKEWNNSTYFALTVGILSDLITN